MPWSACVLVKECYDPYDFGPEDETITEIEDDGVEVTRLKDVTR